MFAPAEKREPEKIVTHVPKKSIHKKPIIVKKPKVISEEETAQAEVDAMLDVEKKQDALRNKQMGASGTKSLVQESKPTTFGDRLDMRIDSSIIDKVRTDTDKEIKDIENESSRTSVAQKGEESSSEEEEMTEQEKLYGRSEHREHHHKRAVKSAPVM